MKRAIKAGKLYTKKSASHGALAGIPLEDHGITLGALQITRPQGPAFSTEELNLLEGIEQIVGMSLFASHRAEVEQFRLRQLNLVREVSTQIASVLNVKELATRVTELLFKRPLNYYYVAIFTCKPNSNSLRLRASAVAPRKGKKKAAIALEVKSGQGLIGEAAQHGQQIVCDDVRANSRYRFIDSLPETKSEVVIPLQVKTACWAYWTCKATSCAPSTP